MYWVIILPGLPWLFVFRQWGSIYRTCIPCNDTRAYDLATRKWGRDFCSERISVFSALPLSLWPFRPSISSERCGAFLFSFLGLIFFLRNLLRFGGGNGTIVAIRELISYWRLRCSGKLLREATALKTRMVPSQSSFDWRPRWISTPWGWEFFGGGFLSGEFVAAEVLENVFD